MEQSQNTLFFNYKCLKNLKKILYYLLSDLKKKAMMLYV